MGQRVKRQRTEDRRQRKDVGGWRSAALEVGGSSIGHRVKRQRSEGYLINSI